MTKLKQAIFVVLYLPEVRKVYGHSHDFYVSKIQENTLITIAEFSFDKADALNFLEKYPKDFLGDNAEKVVKAFNRFPKKKRVYIAQAIVCGVPI